MGISTNYRIDMANNTSSVSIESANSSTNNKAALTEENGYKSIIDFMEISLSGLYKAVQEYSDRSIDNADKNSESISEDNKIVINDNSKVIHDVVASNETIDYSRKNIINRVDDSMSAQANMNSLNVLYLLQ